MKKKYKENSVDTYISFPKYPIYNFKKNIYKELYSILKPGATCIIGVLGINKQYLDLISINIRLSGLLLKDVVYYIAEKESIPILMFIKPNDGSYADNALKWGVADLNVDGGRINFISEEDKKRWRVGYKSKHMNNARTHEWSKHKQGFNSDEYLQSITPNNKGRFSANIILDEKSAKMLDEQSGVSVSRKNNQNDNRQNQGRSMFIDGMHNPENSYNDKGGASRFFYKANTIQELIDYLKKLTKMPNKNQLYIDYFDELLQGEKDE